MTHSHMPVQHLLEQMKGYVPGRGDRDTRPACVAGLIDAVADLFEPVDHEVGRVGFDCHLAEDRWVVGLYLGGIEIVGGSEDGVHRHTAFRFNLLTLAELFDEVDQLRLVALPGDVESDTRASIHVEGRIDGESVRLLVHAVPPTDAGPAFREFPDGTCEPV